MHQKRERLGYVCNPVFLTREWDGKTLELLNFAPIYKPEELFVFQSGLDGFSFFDKTYSAEVTMLSNKLKEMSEQGLCFTKWPKGPH